MVPMSAAIPHAAAELDLRLAEEILEGGAPALRNAERRSARDVRWIIGLLGFRGLNVTSEDVLAVLEGRPGRFRPEHAETTWIKGFQAAIDEIDRYADFGNMPDGAGLMKIHARVTSGFRLPKDDLRRDLPWERIAGVDYVPAEFVREALARFSVPKRPRAACVHPVQEAARLCRAFVQLSPFVDFNLPMACLAGSWALLSAGYPPFLLHGGDRATFAEIVAAPREAWEHWFAEIVLTSYESLSA